MSLEVGILLVGTAVWDVCYYNDYWGLLGDKVGRRFRGCLPVTTMSTTDYTGILSWYYSDRYVNP